MPVPPSIRPYLRFRRLTGPALDATLKALVEDEVFRARVRAAHEELVGRDRKADADPARRAAALVLEQPSGWRDDLQDLVATASAEAEEADAVTRARRLAIERERLQAERDQATDQARSQELALEAVRRELAEALEVGERLRERLERSVEEAEGLAEERRRAVRDLKATEARLAARSEELRLARAERRRLADELEHARGRAAAEAEGRTTPQPTTGGDAPPSTVGGDRSEAAAVDRERVAGAVARAARAAAALTDAIGDVASAVAGEPVGGARTEPGDRVARPVVSSPSTGSAASGRAAARRAPRLPVGVFDDSAAAAEHLLRLSGVVVLVDGYNVTLEGWPALALHEQRARLVDGLGVLAARTGCRPIVVFDGADAGRGLPGESRPRGVQVRFTEPDIEADDELLALVEEVPLDRPVVVVSSDRRVAAGAARRGAATLTAAQLIGAVAG